MPQDSAFEIADEARGRLEDLREALNGRIHDLLLRLGSKDGVLIRGELANAQEVTTEILGAIRSRGAPVVASFLEEACARVVTEVLSQADTRPPPGFAATAAPELDAIVRGQTVEVAKVFGSAADAVRRAIDQGISTSAQLADLITQVGDTIDTTFARASSAVDTAIISTGRAIVIRQAEAGSGNGEEFVFKYVGPRDSKVRTFCQSIRGKYFTRGAMERLDNGPGQPKPVSVYGGGFNCRHSWAPILRAQAEDEQVTIQE